MSAYVLRDASRARRLSDEVNRRLLDSLRYVFDEVGSQLEIDQIRAGEWLAQLSRARRAAPLVHAQFHALVGAVQDGRMAVARDLARRLLEQPGAAATQWLMNLDDARLGTDAAALFAPFVDLEEDNRLDIVPAAEHDLARITAMFAEAREMMGRHDPELLGEFEALVSDVIVVGQGQEHRLTLGAVSCFEVWGGLFLNPGLQRDALELVGTIAHENTHFLLFAYALDEPLILNDAEERHYSPLREERRSMDGVYHATIVSARMVDAFRRQLASGALSPQFADLAERRIALALEYFDGGVEIIRKSGKLSPLAGTILEEAVDLVRHEPRRQRLIA